MAETARARPVAQAQPVARVVVDIGLPHLDRPFDYLVPESMAATAVPGARVRVRFAGVDHDGFVLERADASAHEGKLATLRRVVSSEPVLTSHVARLARMVADRYAGTMPDVLRLAIPPRHAATEKKPSPPAPEPPPRPDAGAWREHVHGVALLDAVHRMGPAGRAAGDGSQAGEPGDDPAAPQPRDAAGERAPRPVPRAVWNPGPGVDWADSLARLVATALSAGRGAVIVLPDGRDVARLDAAMRELLGPDHHVVLGAEAGPAERYRRWLRVLRGSVRAVIGTRSAAFAPVADLGLVGIWDDGDDLHAEPRAPYPHMREVLLLRAHIAGVAAVVGGFARSAEAQLLLDTGWARSVEQERATVRERAPSIHTVGDETEQSRDEAARSARLPSLAWRVARAGLERGPVLVQVARAGYVAALACARCRAPARCGACGAALELDDAAGVPRCSACGTAAPGWRCAECGHDRLRAAVVGVRRTAEELGRAFPGVAVVRSSAAEARADAGTDAIAGAGTDARAGTGTGTGTDGDAGATEQVAAGAGTVDDVGTEPKLVVATHGAEPVASGGYAAALLLDGTSLCSRPGLRASEEALRRWLRAAALVRPGTAGGEIVIVAEPSIPAVQALVRWDPGGFAIRELGERAELHFPPAARLAELRGAADDVDELRSLTELPPISEVLGPRTVDGTTELIIRVPRASGTQLAAALRAAAGVRSARRSGGAVRIRIDPVDIA
ncbi:primosomal protein N' [Actinobacteria bacterium YIM 96077]|uniref:Probable replication restart protein PriA n=1 Tax=Phytoactinopolyspora halophila TaxID=1981511 RepID=A0A329QJJ3_9ACTN|nr:primosomal protein N' [Phytoactinopolyspora halophila]AYY13538.1 primosomal protein N' [Actinobacteria bacterium YIM 96077]RAW12406.1 primosome assembly protein PriA [Phytoactinopolyspora halophila]